MTTTYTIELPGKVITRSRTRGRSKGQREPAITLAHGLKREDVLTTLARIPSKSKELLIVEVVTSLKPGYDPTRKIVDDLNYFSVESIAKDAKKDHLESLIWNAKHGLTREAAESARAELASMGLMWNGERMP